MAERIIDATDMILGRVATYAAKMALNGDTVNVVNCDKARITGMRPVILEDQLHMRERGNIRQGPYVFKNSDAYLRRVIRGMLRTSSTADAARWHASSASQECPRHSRQSPLNHSKTAISRKSSRPNRCPYQRSA